MTAQMSRVDAARELLHRRLSRRNLIPFCKQTHPTYQANWHHQLIADHLEQLSAGKLTEHLMIFAPPRHGKSEQIAVRFPAWELGERPHEHYITTAYGDELAATFSRACRNTIESPSYQRLWPHKFKSRNDTKWELRRKIDDHRATYISSGILSALTGEGATRLLVDDPVKNKEEAYSKLIRNKTYDNYLTAASTRMQPQGKKVLVMTRWHEDDLAGRLLTLAVKNKTADQWIVIVLAATNDEGKDSYIWNTRTGVKTFFPPYAALWPEAYNREALDNTAANLGQVFWNAMYMQRPTTPGGEIFKRDNWGWFDSVPHTEIEHIVQVYDGACKEKEENDYSASLTIASTGTKFPILDQWRDKVTFPHLMAKVYERWQQCADLYNRYPDRLLVEDKSSGTQIAQQIETNNMVGVWTFPSGETKNVPPIPVTRIPATVSKEIRARGISGYHEAKLILLPRGADWVDDFVDSCALFPKGINDDWEDCLVHGITYYTRPTEEQEMVQEYYQPITISHDLDEVEQMSGF
jgi:predicted phage terminase large subunit-like protein